MVDYTYVHYLTQKQLNSIVKSMSSCIDIVYKVGSLSYFQCEYY